MTTAGNSIEQLRYRITAGERGLYAQRLDGRVALIDVPLDHDDRVYLVERHVESMAELDALCHAYVADSERADRPARIVTALDD